MERSPSNAVVFHFFFFLYTNACAVTTTPKHRNTSIGALFFHTKRTRRLVPELASVDDDAGRCLVLVRQITDKIFFLIMTGKYFRCMNLWLSVAYQFQRVHL